MSNGGYKGSTPARETSPEQYPGVWELTEQFQAQADGNWPFQDTDCAPKGLRFNSADTATLSKSISSAGNRKTWTFSFWVKLLGGGTYSTNHILCGGLSGSSSSQSGFEIEFTSTGALLVNNQVNNSVAWSVQSTALFRDYSAWYHVVVAHDTTQATESNRLKIYVNGVQLDSFATTNYPSQNYESEMNKATTNRLGATDDGGNPYLPSDFYLADIHFIDGQALTPDAFTFIDGQGIIQPKRFTGDYSSGAVWSNFLTSSGSFATSSEGPDKAFDGIATAASRAKGSTDNILTFDISSFGFTGLFELWSQNTGAEFSIDGGSNWSAIGDDVWTTVSSDISGVSTIQMRPASGATMKVSAFKSQGQLLTDASVGRNSFHLDFSDEVKDQSGLGNDWTANNISSPKGYIAGISINAPSNVTLQSAEHHKMFNGSKDDYCYAHTNDATNFIQWTPTGGYPTDGHIWIQGGDGNGGGADGMTVEINGAAVSRAAVVDNETYSSGSYGWGDWHKYAVAGNTLNSLKLIGAYALIRQLSTVADPTHSALGISDDNDVPAIVDTFLSTQDYFIDSPVNGNEASTGAGGERRGNYCVMNPLDAPGCTLTNGNLNISCGGSKNGRGTIWPSSGKYYFEFDITTYGNPYVGIGSHGSPQHYVSKNSIAINNTGHIYVSTDGAQTYPGYSVALNATGSYMCAFDLDNGKIWWGKDGTWYKQHTSANTTTTKSEVEAGNGAMDFSGHPNFGEEWTVQFGTSSNTSAYAFNAGQRAFKYASSIPSGFSPIATSFLPEPSIPIPSQYFDTKLYTGNGGTQNITGLNFSPELTWIKTRIGSGNHHIFDVVRGVNKSLHSDTSASTETTTAGLTSFDSNGFSIGNSNNDINGNVITFVSWNWDAGDATTTIAAGSLNSSAYDQSQTWSNYVTGTAYSGYPITNAFNGDTSTRSLESGSTGHTFTPPSALTVNSTLRVYLQYANSSATNALKVNGTDKSSLITTTGSNLGWLTIPGITSITSLFWGVSPAGAETCSISAIEVDGKLLVDSGVSVANVPTVASTVRSSPESGFSIVTYTGGSSTPANSDSGDSFGHGLGASPKLVICKNRTGGNSWPVYHASTALGALVLDGDNAIDTASYLFAQKHPTSSVVYLGNNPEINNSSENYVAYCFAPVEGYSAFGSYVGNGGSSGNGPFVYTGFKTRWVMMKASSPNHAGSWVMYDTTRDTASSGEGWLYANSTASEQAAATYAVHTTSNGFRMAGTSAENNGSGRTYIYAAFAESPFKNARAR